ncbi:MAG TPA: helicase-related protein [Candidatus Acidoferrales bacterium]|nr:helicase-related protein [Candidatus Acidoferrales bacterium]
MKPLLTEKDVANRGWPQFAIEQFLGEPDSITNGRRYHNAQKVVLAETQPAVVDAIRRHKPITQAALRKRGWTRSDIKALLGEPDLIVPNPEFGVEAPVKLYRIGRIEDAEGRRADSKARFFNCERVIHVGSCAITLRGSIRLEDGVDAPDEADAIAEGLQTRLNAVVAREFGEGAVIEMDDTTYVSHSLAHAADRAFFELEPAYKKLAAAQRRAEAEAVMAFYLESFPKEGRHFEYFCGPTNSGKTHAAMEELRAATSGAYLAPLRLLALEVHERMNEMGVPTSLLTGEERTDVPGAAHVSSTVEMADLRASYDVAVIDEAQMLEDSQRGWAWTLAALGVRASRIILCGSVEGLRATRRLAERMGLEVSVRRFERKNPLEVDAAIEFRSIRAGDAVIVFSRREVIETQRAVGELGFSTAVVYGSLSPSVRREEAARFRNGDAEVLVATDAIAMGLNLPIQRIVFSTTSKWNGKAERWLGSMETRQIAGRAGRYGLHETGKVTAFTERDLERVRAAVESDRPEEAADVIWVAPTTEHLERLAAINGQDEISRLLRFFQQNILRADRFVKLADLSEMIEAVEFVERNAAAFAQLPLEIRYAYARAPVNRNGMGYTFLARWAQLHARGLSVSGEETAGVSDSDRLLTLEETSRLATLYMWLSQRFPRTYSNAGGIERVRESADEQIRQALLNRGRAGNRRKAQRRHRTKVDLV